MVRSTGLLRIEILTGDPSLGWSRTWPLEFSLRGAGEVQRGNSGKQPTLAASSEKIAAGTRTLTGQGEAALAKRLGQGSSAKDKLTANAAFTVAEKAIGLPKASWDGAMVRALFDGWIKLERQRKASPDHEETWFQVAGYLLRPGTGVLGDAARLESLWPLLTGAPYSPRNSVKIQRWICARRIAAGFDATQSLQLWESVSADWPAGATPSAEIALLAGALEKLPVALRSQLIGRFVATLRTQPNDGASWKALGRLLARGLFHAGPENVVSPESVVQAWDELRELNPSDSVRADAIQTWLRAARRTGVRALDVPSSCRNQIDDHLRRWTVSESRRRLLHEVMPVAAADLTSLLGEGLPPGLSLSTIE